MQGTVATFSAGSDTVLLDDGAELSYDASAFARSGWRLLRLGQRVRMRIVAGRIEAITHVSFPLPGEP